MSHKVVAPEQGGCWFCWSDHGSMVLDYEFDTFVHIDCIKKALEQDSNHPEAQFMKYLIKE